MMVVQNASLWHFHIHVYCTPVGFIPSIILPYSPFFIKKKIFVLFIVVLEVH
jgi:hypothetical protein